MPRSSGSTAWIRHRIPYDQVWRLCDARGQILGRVASQIATILMGKHKPTYLDNIFTGDPVVVVNAAHFALTGRKMSTKHITSHTGRPGGLKRRPVRAVLERRPTHPLFLAVKRMLPANRLRSVRLANLHLYADESHPHESQAPVLLPPAHAGDRLGRGGPPERGELESWWLDHLSDAPDRVLKPIVSSAKSGAQPSRGLLELLDVADEKAGDEANAKRGSSADVDPRRVSLKRYAQMAAEMEKTTPSYPVVVPS